MSSEWAAKLMSPDSIMEPGVVDAMKGYLESGGQAETAIDMLSDSYRGYAEMASLVGDWLQIAGVEHENVIATVSQAIGDAVFRSFDNYPQLDDALSQSADPPAWLEQMVLIPQWRHLIYKLADKYPSCAMLNFAIKKISDLGFSMEIAEMSGMATMNFDVFLRILTEFVTSLLTCDEPTFHKQLSLFRSLCASNEHTFLFTQVFLHNLERLGVQGARRLSQEIYVTATDAQHSVATSLAQQVRLLLLQDKTPDSDQSLTILRMMKVALAAHSFTPSDVSELYRDYTKPQPPPVQFLWDFEILDLFLGHLFDVQRSPGQYNNQEYLYLVAYASSYTGNPVTDGIACKRLIDALSTITSVCSRSVSLSELKAGVEAIVKNDYIRRYPVISMGCIIWARQNLLDPEFFAYCNSDFLLPVHFLFLKSVVAYHPLQRRRVFELACAGYSVSLPSDLLAMQKTLKRGIVDLLVDLVISGFVVPVLNQIEAWGTDKQLDYAYVRTFLGSLFQSIEPPYDPVFVKDMVMFLDHSWILGAFKDPMFRTSKGYQEVACFLANCEQMQKESQTIKPESDDMTDKDPAKAQSLFSQKVLDTLKTLRDFFRSAK